MISEEINEANLCRIQTETFTDAIVWTNAEWYIRWIVRFIRCVESLRIKFIRIGEVLGRNNRENYELDRMV